MVSAWDVYWVMQADTIGSVAFALSIFLGLAAVALTVVSAMQFDMSKIWDEDHKKHKEYVSLGTRARGLARTLALWFLPVMTVTTLMPSSKTMAAMILVPAITSEHVVAPVTAEAKELYALAKQALREIAKNDKPEKEAQQ